MGRLYITQFEMGAKDGERETFFDTCIADSEKEAEESFEMNMLSMILRGIVTPPITNCGTTVIPISHGVDGKIYKATWTEVENDEELFELAVCITGEEADTSSMTHEQRVEFLKGEMARMEKEISDNFVTKDGEELAQGLHSAWEKFQAMMGEGE